MTLLGFGVVKMAFCGKNVQKKTYDKCVIDPRNPERKIEKGQAKWRQQCQLRSQKGRFAVAAVPKAI